MAEDISTVSPPLAGLASEADRRFQEALQTGRSEAGPPEEPAAADRLREAGELARRAFASAASEADRRFREAVEGVTAESVQAAPSHQPR